MSSEVRMSILRYLDRARIHFNYPWRTEPVAFAVNMTLIAKVMHIAPPTASRHLHILREAGFITIRKSQKWSYCMRDDVVIHEYLVWLQGRLSASGEWQTAGNKTHGSLPADRYERVR